MEQIQEWARFIVENEALLLTAAGIIIGIIATLADTLHDVIKGIESSGAKPAKVAVKNQTSLLRPWSKIIVGTLKMIAEKQEGTK